VKNNYPKTCVKNFLKEAAGFFFNDVKKKQLLKRKTIVMSVPPVKIQPA